MKIMSFPMEIREEAFEWRRLSCIKSQLYFRDSQEQTIEWPTVASLKWIASNSFAGNVST